METKKYWQANPGADNSPKMPVLPPRTESLREQLYTRGLSLYRGDDGRFEKPVFGGTVQTEDIEGKEFLSFELNTEEGIEEARQHVEDTYAQAVTAHDTFEGKWPNRKIYPGLYKSIGQERTRILGALAGQEDFLLKRSIKDNGAEIAARITQLSLMVDALYGFLNEHVTKTQEPLVESVDLESSAEAVSRPALALEYHPVDEAARAEEDQLMFDYWWQTSQNETTDDTISPEQRRQNIWDRINALSAKGRARLLSALTPQSAGGESEKKEQSTVPLTSDQLEKLKIAFPNTWENLKKKIFDVYDGWPSLECVKLYENIARLYKSLERAIRLQDEFFLGNGTDKSAEIRASWNEFGTLVDKLYASIQDALAEGWGGTAYDAVPGNEGSKDTIDAQEFEAFKQRIHRRQENIDSALKYFESHSIAPEHQHYLDDLVICRKAITDIVVAGLEEGKAQDATVSEKVYSAELVKRAEPYRAQITDIMYAIEDLYALKVTAAGKEDEVDEQKPETATAEPRVLSPAEEMKLLETFFLPNMEGQDDVEKLALLRKQLRELPPEEWTDALLDAREAFTDEELEQLLGPVVTPTPVSGGVAPAPVSPAPFIPGAAAAAAVMPGVPPQPAAPKAPEPAPAAAPEKTLTPEQQATRAKWLAARKKLLFSEAADGAEAASANRYEDPTQEEMFAALRDSQREKALERGAWEFGKIGADGTLVLTTEGDPLTFFNRLRGVTANGETDEILKEYQQGNRNLTPDQEIEFRWAYFQSLTDIEKQEWYLYAKERNGELGLSEDARREIFEDEAMQVLNLVGTRKLANESSLQELYENATDEDKQRFIAMRDKAVAELTDLEKANILSLHLAWSTPEERANLLSAQPENDTEVPLQNKYQNELTAHYDSLKTEGSFAVRGWQRLKATFGFKPELPPELDATREAMFDATADYTKETREMLKLRKETGKEIKRALTKERKAELLRLHVMRYLTTTAAFTNMYEEYKVADVEAKKTLLLEAQAQVDQLPPKERTNAMERAMESVDTFLTPEQQAAYAVEAQEAVQRRYEKMLGRSVLMGTFERQLEAQQQVTEDLAFQAPEVLKKHKRKLSLFAAGAIGGITGGASSAVMGVTRALAGGLLGASIGGFVGEKWKNRIERETEKGKGAVLDSLAQRLSKDSITATELEDTYQELKKIYEKADSQTRTRIASLMAMALAIGLATGQTLEFGAEKLGLIDTPDAGGSAAATSQSPEGVVTGSGEAPASDATEISGSESSPGGTGGTEGGEAAAGKNVGADSENAASPETLKPYTAERGDNMWDILEGQTEAGELPFMEQVDPDKLQGLLKEVELKLDADDSLRAEIGFGDSSHDLGLGDKVDLEELNKLALKIAEEKGMLADANVAEAVAADATPEAAPAESVETFQADASDAGAGPEKTVTADAAQEQAPPLTVEAAVEAAIAKAEAAADTGVDSDSVIPGAQISAADVTAGLTVGAAVEAIKASGGARFTMGSERVKAYAADYEGGALRFVSQEVQPFVEQTEGVASNGFFGLFNTPPPPSMGGYALFQHVPLREMAELNNLPDNELLATLAEKYHVENPEQFSVWVKKLNDMQGRGVFNLDQTPELTLADAVALDVINSKTTSV